MVLMAGYDIPLRAIRRQITSSINLIIQAERLQGGSRKVTGMTEVVGMEGETIVMQEIFAYVQSGIDAEGRAKGKFVATGVRPDFATRLRKAGVELPTTLFQERTLLRA
jgi:pilus assembly protein CpaF